ncbi:unnamed protein product [Caenorhabditis auriculariae]|uniref:Calponin-homology (CH) domain-containing protein n=1 Tax=Caenorhabditis auriculariae TaxID=2777116 RepID=A0A8S1GMR6_9PELO|nr:unnamed protein product [Caenorhabditis auriculariae]
MSVVVEQQESTEVKEVVPEVPTTLPPIDEVVIVKSEIKAEDNEETTAAAAAENEAAVEKEKPKVTRRFTFNKRWGKHRDEAQIPKEPEQPKDPKEDVLGWISQQTPQAVHKVNYLLLEWVQRVAVENEADRKPLPGKDGFVTRNQFLAFLRDGDLLTKLANKLQPGSVEPAVAEENADAVAQKEVVKKNIDSFSTWAQQNVNMDNDKVLTSGDLLEKGKSGFEAVFNTLWQLGVQTQEKFAAEGIDVETIVNAASQIVKSNILQTILGFFRRARVPPVVEEPKEAEVVATTEVQEPAAVEEIKLETTAPSAVAAN